MISRYTRLEMGQIWSDENKFRCWLRVETAASLTLGEPLTAGLLGVLFLHEALSGIAIIGIFLIFAGLTFLTISQPQPSTTSP